LISLHRKDISNDNGCSGQAKSLQCKNCDL
jgi:hypothetical protein